MAGPFPMRLSVALMVAAVNRPVPSAVTRRSHPSITPDVWEPAPKSSTIGASFDLPSQLVSRLPTVENI
jgi:hypothetical protein